ncbi:nucleotidyl transferase AbiEii/AbiGii toxin family protein, partial [Fibrobacterota bacterium]
NQNANLNYPNIIKCFKEYMIAAGHKPPAKKRFQLNLDAKLNDADFRGDMEALLRPGIVYNQDDAFDWIKTVLLELL